MMVDPDAEVTDLEAQGRRENVVDARATKRAAQLQAAAARQMNEWKMLDSKDEKLAWLRKELQARKTTAAQLLPTMDEDRSGTIGVNEFER